MDTYTKLFNSIITSTIWTEDDQTRIVWFTLMAMSDRNGEVVATIPGLANTARVSIEACEKAIARFMEPDKYSRSKEFEGRRIEETEEGWALLNHAKYRARMSKEDQREKARIRKQRQRERERALRDCPDSSSMSPHTDTDTDADGESDTKEVVIDTDPELTADFHAPNGTTATPEDCPY